MAKSAIHLVLKLLHNGSSAPLMYNGGDSADRFFGSLTTASRFMVPFLDLHDS